MMLEVNGVRYTNFVSANVEIRLDALSNTFSFEAVAPQGQPLPFKGGESCTIYVDDEKVLTGHIEVVAVSYDSGQHSINVSGRDRTGDLLDSTIGAISDIRGDNLTLKALIEQVIAHIGLDLKVIDEVNPPPFTGAEDIAAPEPGDNAFGFIESYARKRHVLLTSNGNGDVVISTNSGVRATGRVQHIIDAPDNNVIASNFSFDTTGRFNLYQLSSELNPTALNLSGDATVSEITNQSGRVFDNAVRKGRQLVLISEVPQSNTNCKDRAEWEASVRKARGLVYSATVEGYRADSELWQVNRVYQIVDDFIGKIEPMLCNSVTFSIDSGAGSITTLGFVGKNAYTEALKDDPLSEVAGNVA